MPSQHRSVTLETSFQAGTIRIPIHKGLHDPRPTNPHLCPEFHFQFFSSTKLPSFLFLSYYTTLHYPHHQISHQPFGTIYPSRHPPPTIAFPRPFIVALPDNYHLDWTNQPRLSPWLALGSTFRSNTAWPFQHVFRPSAQK
ncbi:hypothetical protein GE21DRAFT_1063538 [Neurospora crassa]|nr:hypothetical protein GE21DRAFT_1063538 [Neurospora crassa]